MTQRFDTPNPILVDVRLPAGDVELEAGETSETDTGSNSASSASRSKSAV